MIDIRSKKITLQTALWIAAFIVSYSSAHAEQFEAPSTSHMLPQSETFDFKKVLNKYNEFEHFNMRYGNPKFKLKPGEDVHFIFNFENVNINPFITIMANNYPLQIKNGSNNKIAIIIESGIFGKLSESQSDYPFVTPTDIKDNTRCFYTNNDVYFEKRKFNHSTIYTDADYSVEEIQSCFYAAMGRVFGLKITFAEYIDKEDFDAIKRIGLNPEILGMTMDSFAINRLLKTRN